MAHVLLNGTFNAGGGYADVWARDTATFIDIAMEVNPNAVTKSVLLGFLCRQKADGELPGGYRPHAGHAICEGAAPPPGDESYHSCLGGTEMCKNNAETDQESSVVQAIQRYVNRSGDVSFLQLTVNGTSVLRRLEMALEWLQQRRMDEATGLLWGGTTIDWGDVQPEPSLPDERLLSEGSHPSLDVYDNAMFLLAIDGYVALSRAIGISATGWEVLRNATAQAVRTHLWDGGRRKFTPHLYLDAAGAARAARQAGVPSFESGSPFPPSFDEMNISCHGGTAVAALAGVLGEAELRASYATMQRDAAEAGRVTLGLTVYPPYPTALYPNMPSWTYQNGGDWGWFGGRLVSALAAAGMRGEAARALKPMVDRVVAHGGFYEWWDRTGQPQGSSLFHGAAGVLGLAIQHVEGTYRP